MDFCYIGLIFWIRPFKGSIAGDIRDVTFDLTDKSISPITRDHSLSQFTEIDASVSYLVIFLIRVSMECFSSSNYRQY